MSDENQLTEDFSSTDDVATLDGMKGKFVESLKRKNSKIREDRAVAIGELAELFYKRKIEDLRMQLKTLIRSRESMLDLSPTDANSLKLASDFDADEFVNKDIDLGIEIRNIQIKIKIAEDRYNLLFT